MTLRKTLGAGVGISVGPSMYPNLLDAYPRSIGLRCTAETAVPCIRPSLPPRADSSGLTTSPSATDYSDDDDDDDDDISKPTALDSQGEGSRRFDHA
ncbi:hypothetical protein BKA70DRAFT_1430013 [Coprinopsis sp. MPI-PUGE-AT-0042]|nr:hypothetical protein BKA70DRAFT_1430013 [Coprinopsis sp. MPI-PUGE-AT-0042]